MSDQSVFEIIVHDGNNIENGHCYRIWADGRIEGFGAQAIVINRIPQHVNRAVLAWAERSSPSRAITSTAASVTRG